LRIFLLLVFKRGLGFVFSSLIRFKSASILPQSQHNKLSNEIMMIKEN
jgi:hypothetical protein